MARTTRCKMVVNRIELQNTKIPEYEEETADGRKEIKKDDNGNPIYRQFNQPKVVLNPVYAPQPLPDAENHKFWTASPAGECWLSINNPEGAEIFEVGEEYYVDFVRAD